MWDMRRRLDFDPPPDHRRVIQFQYPDAPKQERNWWLILAPEAPVDLCSIDPGHDVDLYVTAPLAGHDRDLDGASIRCARRAARTG